MNALSPTTPILPVRSAAPASSGGDMLAAMRPALDTAAAIGQPTSKADATAILATTGSYVRGATETMGKLDEHISARREQLESLRASDPEAARGSEEQIDLMQRLRDRIALSIERVNEATLGSRKNDEHNAELDQLAVLQQRRTLLAQRSSEQLTQPSPSLVAGAYGAGMSRAVSA